MILQHEHLKRRGRVDGTLICGFNHSSGDVERYVFRGFRHSLSVSVDNRPYENVLRLRGPVFAKAALVPDFGQYELSAAEDWLEEVVDAIAESLGESGIPVPRDIETGKALLISSAGTLAFDPETGGVRRQALTEDYEKIQILCVDVAEWRHRYPGEKVANSHDILDFGYWYEDEDGNIRYEPPAEGWRLDRERLREEENSENEHRMRVS